MSDLISIRPLPHGQSAVRIYLRETFFNAHSQAVQAVAEEHGADFIIHCPGDRMGFRVAQYHVPTDKSEEFKGAVLRVTNNQQLQHKPL